MLACRIGGMGTYAEIRVTKVGGEVARLVKEECRLIPEPNDDDHHHGLYFPFIHFRVHSQGCGNSQVQSYKKNIECGTIQ